MFGRNPIPGLALLWLGAWAAAGVAGDTPAPPPRPARALESLGTVAFRQRDLAAAEGFCREALAIRRERAPGALQTAVTLDQLARIARGRQRLAAAQAYFQQALAIEEKLNPESLFAARSLNALGAYTHVPALRFAAADARDLAAALQAQAGPGKLYRSAAGQVLTDTQATLPAIRQALAWFTRDVQPGETLLLVLSGHGVKMGDHFYFAPVDADPAGMAETALPWPEVLAALQGARAKARSIWVLADCCRAAPGLEQDRQRPAVTCAPASRTAATW